MRWLVAGFMCAASTVWRAAPTAAIIRSEPMAMRRSQAAKGTACSPSAPDA
jgi:hypothetical protein